MLPRLWLALATALALTLAWDMPLLLPVKYLVVYVHELGHGLVALLSGAYLQEIQITSNEWGETLIRSLEGIGNFFLTVSAGYLGSTLAGAFLLNRGLVGRWERLTLGLFASLLLYSGFLFTSPGSLSFYTALLWAMFLGALCLGRQKYIRMGLLLLGVFFVWYCFYDLFDFTKNIEATDAGILARYWIDEGVFLSDTLNENQLSITFSLFWLLCILGIVTFSLMNAIRSYPKRAVSFAPDTSFANNDASNLILDGEQEKQNLEAEPLTPQS